MHSNFLFLRQPSFKPHLHWAAKFFAFLLTLLALVACVLLLAHAFFQGWCIPAQVRRQRLFEVRCFVSDGQRHPLLLCLLASPPLSLLSLTRPFLYLFGLCPCTGSACSMDVPPHPSPGQPVPSSRSLPWQYLTVTPVLRSVLIYCPAHGLARNAVCGPPGRLQLWCRAAYIPTWMRSPRLRAPWGPPLHLARLWFRGTLSPLVQRGCVRDKQSLKFVAAMEIDNRGETFFPCEALNCTDCTAFLLISKLTGWKLWWNMV